MPKSRNRKNHKQKANSRSLKINSQKEAFRNKLMNQMMSQQQEYKTTEDTNVEIDTSGLELENIENTQDFSDISDISVDIPDIIEDNQKSE